MHRMRWPSLFICCGGDQLSPAGKYLSSCHSETSPQTGRGNPHFLAVDAQVPSSEWERQRVCCCVNSPYVPYRMKLLKAKEVQKPSVSGGSFAYFSSCWEKWAAGGTFLTQKGLLKESHPSETKEERAAGGKKKLLAETPPYPPNTPSPSRIHCHRNIPERSHFHAQDLSQSQHPGV